MMLEMKRVVLLLCLVLLTCAAPFHQNNDLSTSQEPQVTSRVIQYRGTSGNDIIITTPAGFGKPNKYGESIVTVSLRDENTKVSVDVVSFIFSVSSEELSKAELGDSGEGTQANGAGAGRNGEKNNTDKDGDLSEEGLDPTARTEVLNSDEELDKSEEETPNQGDNMSEDLKHRGPQPDTRDDAEELDPDHTNILKPKIALDIFTLEENSNESHLGSEHQRTEIHGKPLRQLSGLRSAHTLTKIHEESTSVDANGNVAEPRIYMSPVEVQTVPTTSEPMLGPLHTDSALSSSLEEETDDEYKSSVTDSTPSKTPRLNSGPESMENTQVVKNNGGPPTPSFSGSDFDPEYVNDEWQYDPRYYDPYNSHPGYDPYGAGYDPYGEGYDPYGAGYDPYQAGYDPYQAGYDPYQAGYDPYQAGYDPYGAGYDPYQTGYDPYSKGYEPYRETESEDPRYDVEQKTTPAYSVEENGSHPTEISNNQETSYSEEQPQGTSISPSSIPVLLPEGDSTQTIPSEEPSNSSSIETSIETGPQPLKGPNDTNALPDPVEEGTYTTACAWGKKKAATGSSSSEESMETTDSEQESQNLMNQPGNQGTPDPTIQTSSHMSVVQDGLDIQEIHNEEGPQSQSHVYLMPAFSSEENDPLVNTVEHIMGLKFNGGSKGGTFAVAEEATVPSNNTISKNNQNEEYLSNESATESPGVSAHESVDLTTQRPALDSESVPTSDSLVSNEDASRETSTPIPSANLHTTTQNSEGLDNSAEANANGNTANDSEESQESQLFIPSSVFPIANQRGHVQHTDHSSDEENTRDGTSNQGRIGQFSVETPTKILSTNVWTSFLQVLNVPIANQSRLSVQKYVQRPQSTRRYHQRNNRRQKSNSSEESK